VAAPRPGEGAGDPRFSLCAPSVRKERAPLASGGPGGGAGSVHGRDREKGQAGHPVLFLCRQKLEKHLRVLRRVGLIAEWHDRNIDAGEDWAKAIDRNLATADIVLLLVSASVLASDDCWGEEMEKALARHGQGEATVIPVILRPCRWQSTPLAPLQAVPKDGLPVTSWPDRDAAFDDVVVRIERVVRGLTQGRADGPPAPGPLGRRLPQVEEVSGAETAPVAAAAVVRAFKD
jgi:hypothetical protein